jgi:hypothetical protein
MASRELSKFEQDTLVEALTQIDAAGKAQKIAEYAAAIEQERSGRAAAEAKVGELTAELAKRGEAYRAALADMDSKLLQAREARSTADVLSAQYRAEAEGERRKSAEIEALVTGLREQITALMEMEIHEVEPTVDSSPVPYRINVVGRDAAGDLRTLELVPIERK